MRRKARKILAMAMVLTFVGGGVSWAKEGRGEKHGHNYHHGGKGHYATRCVVYQPVRPVYYCPPREVVYVPAYPVYRPYYPVQPTCPGGYVSAGFGAPEWSLSFSYQSR